MVWKGGCPCQCFADLFEQNHYDLGSDWLLVRGKSSQIFREAFARKQLDFRHTVSLIHVAFLW